MSSVFLDYAKYYDLMYRDKDYQSESEFIISQIKKYAPNARNLLNLGCGTGKHDELLAQAGYEVTGVDLSSQMIAIAKKNNKSPKCTYVHGDARNLSLEKKFDVVLSLFHVLSYQTSNEDVLNFMRSAYKNLNDGGICIMDYWYGPAVLNLKPEKRKKTFDSEDMSVIRHSETDMNYVANVATVNFAINIQDKKNKTSHDLLDKHPMRYFFSPELLLFADISKLKQIHHAEWMKPETFPSETSWAAYSIFRK